MDRNTILNHIQEEIEGAKLYMDEALKMLGNDPEMAEEFFHMAKQEVCHAARLTGMMT